MKKMYDNNSTKDKRQKLKYSLYNSYMWSGKTLFKVGYDKFNMYTVKPRATTKKIMKCEGINP